MSSKNHKVAKLPAKTLQYPMRLDQALLARGLAYSRSKAEEAVRDGRISVNGIKASKPGQVVSEQDIIKSKIAEEYVSRAGLKLASVAKKLKLNFQGKMVLDVGSSTGGFTDFALRHGAKKVIAVDVGTDQLHPTLHGNPRIELHEKTDIRDFKPDETPDIIVMDVSFISARYILPHLATVSSKQTELVIMIKPQFEAGAKQVNKGVIKNSAVRRQILQEFEVWSKDLFVTLDKADSGVAGLKGNLERFYLLKRLR